MASTREEIRIEGGSPPLSHYTDGVRFGDLLFISGVAPLDEDQKLLGGDDVVEQARYIFRTLEKILDRAGASFADVLKVTIYLTDVNDRPKINPIRIEYFGTSKPASTLIGVNSLAVPGMKVEIEAIVGLPKSELSGVPS